MAKGFPSKKKSRTLLLHSTFSQKKSTQQGYWVWGKHSVEAILKEKKREVLDLYLTQKVAGMWTAGSLPKHEIVEIKELTNILGEEAVHQGVAAKIKPYNEACWEDFIEVSGTQCWVALDQVTDPHNVGAILRSAAVFGIRGMLLPKNNAPQETGIMAKAASGSIDLVPRCYVTNLKRTIEDFKKAGFWVVGLAEEGSTMLTDFEWPEKTLFIMGSEGRGLRTLIKEACDYILSISSTGNFSALNVSNASAVCFYAWKASRN